MPDVTLRNSGAANGTATPATLTTAALQANNLAVVVIAALGTSPTIATPSGGGTWLPIQNVSGATVSFAMFYLLPSAGAKSPSSVLAGTVTGWVMAYFEFTAMGANTGLQGSATLSSAVAQLANIFPTAGQTLSNELFIYSVARATATITAQNTVNVPNVVWSSSVQGQAGVQGLSLDTYWLSNLGQGVGQYPLASGLLSGAVASVAIGAWFNTTASQGLGAGEWVGGASGVLVPQYYQGIIGG